MSATAFPEPTEPRAGRADVLLDYLEYFRTRIIEKIRSLSEEQSAQSRLPSGWTPLQLAKHLTYVELRWLVWGFEGRDVDDLWGDSRDRRWYVAADERRDDVLAALQEQGRRTREIVRAHELADTGMPSDRWDGADPPSLERVLLHLMQEYARHLGQLDVVVELAGGEVGE